VWRADASADFQASCLHSELYSDSNALRLAASNVASERCTTELRSRLAAAEAVTKAKGGALGAMGDLMEKLNGFGGG
jgi:hypothetical protein